MTNKMRDRIWGGLIGTGGAVISGIILFWMAGFRVEAQALDKLVNDKIGRNEFEKFEIQNNRDHEELKKENNTDLLLMEKRLKDYYDKRHEDMKDFIEAITNN